MRGYLAVKELQNGAIVEPFDILSDKANALILALSFPEPNACTVFVLDLKESVDDCLRSLPSKMLPAVKPTDRSALLHIFFVHLLDGGVELYFQSCAIFAI